MCSNRFSIELHIHQSDQKDELNDYSWMSTILMIVQ